MSFIRRSHCLLSPWRKTRSTALSGIESSAGSSAPFVTRQLAPSAQHQSITGRQYSPTAFTPRKQMHLTKTEAYALKLKQDKHFKHWQIRDRSQIEQPAKLPSQATEPAYKTYTVRTSTSIEEHLHRTIKHLHTCSPATLASSWNYTHKLLVKRMPVKLRRKPCRLNKVAEELRFKEDQIGRILHKTLERVNDGSFGGKELSRTLLGMAKIVRKIHKEKGRRRMNVNLYAFAHTLLDEEMHPKEEVFRPFLTASQPILKDFASREVMNVAYALAMMGYLPRLEDGRAALHSVADAALPKIEEFDSQELSNLLWSYAALGFRHWKLFHGAADSITKRDVGGLFDPRELGNVVWSYGKAGIPHPGLFKRVGDAFVASDLQTIDPQILGDVVWAYAAAKELHPALFRAIGDALVDLDDLKDFRPRVLSTLVWSYASLGIPHSKLFARVGDTIIRLKNLREFKSQDLSRVVWAFAAADAEHVELFRKVGGAIVDLDELTKFTMKELTDIKWAYETANVSHGKMLKRVDDAIAEFNETDRSIN